jgi:hypothetical protein
MGGKPNDLNLFAHSHIASRSIPLSNHKIPCEAIIPRYVEVATSIVPESNIGKFVCPVLDCIEAVLALLQSGLRGSNSNIQDCRDGCQSSSCD